MKYIEPNFATDIEEKVKSSVIHNNRKDWKHLVPTLAYSL